MNRSPTQHASTIDYNRLRITQKASSATRHATFLLFFLLRQTGIPRNTDSSPRCSWVRRPISPPASMQALATGGPFWARASNRPKEVSDSREAPGGREAGRLHLQDFGTSASWLRPSPATASCLSRVNANAEFSFNIKINETKRNIAERLHQLLPSTRTSTWLCLLALRCPPPDCSVPRGHLPSRTKPPVRSPD